VGAFMTSLDMSGFSLSLLVLNGELESYLRAPTQVTLRRGCTAKVGLPAHACAHQACLLGSSKNASSSSKKGISSEESRFMMAHVQKPERATSLALSKCSVSHKMTFLLLCLQISSDVQLFCRCTLSPCRDKTRVIIITTILKMKMCSLLL
jgi:hypothetical protein